MARDERPFPEDDANPGSLDELNRLLANMSMACNIAPDPEMGGLSPEQVARLIHLPWGEPGSPIQFHAGIPLAELEGSRFFRRARMFLCAVRDQGGVKATSSKNLTRRFVTEIMDDLLSEGECEEVRKYKKAINERDIGPLHISRVVAQCAGLVRLYKGKFVVPKKQVALLAPERAGELFRHLFITFFRKFNLAYLNPYGPEVGSIQSCAGYTLYRLGVIAKDWHDAANLPGESLLPAVRSEVEDEIGNRAFLTSGRLLNSRIISPLIEWDLLEGRYEHKESKHYKSLVSIRTTPLYQNVLRFRIGQS